MGEGVISVSIYDGMYEYMGVWECGCQVRDTPYLTQRSYTHVRFLKLNSVLFTRIWLIPKEEIKVFLYETEGHEEKHAGVTWVYRDIVM